MNNKIIELLWAESGNAISSRGDIMGKNMGHFQIGDSWGFMEILRNSIWSKIKLPKCLSDMHIYAYIQIHACIYMHVYVYMYVCVLISVYMIRKVNLFENILKFTKSHFL